VPHAKRPPEERPPEAPGESVSRAVEELVNRVIRPLGLVVLSRERIQATLDDAAERGRVTRSDANELVAELVRRGRQQTDEMLGELEGLVDRGRGQLGSATRRARRSPPVESIVRGAGRARRTVASGSGFPIGGYDELTVAELSKRLRDLKAPELRRVRDYERRHANRKSLLDAIEKRL
jgi:hypothetical protein